MTSQQRPSRFTTLGGSSSRCYSSKGRTKQCIPSMMISPGPAPSEVYIPSTVQRSCRWADLCPRQVFQGIHSIVYRLRGALRAPLISGTTGSNDQGCCAVHPRAVASDFFQFSCEFAGRTYWLVVRRRCTIPPFLVLSSERMFVSQDIVLRIRQHLPLRI